MPDAIDLVALQKIPVTTGILPVGGVFRASLVEAKRLIASGKAVKRAEANAAAWDGLRWAGVQVAILASGPSMSDKQATAVHAWRACNSTQRKVIAINTTFRRAPWADVLYACDWQWWDAYHQEAKEIFKGEFWTQAEQSKKKYDIKIIRSRRGKGLSKIPGVIHQGENSGYQAIGLAQQLGAKQIFLLGFDMQGCHWHGPHPGKLNRKNIYSSWLEHFKHLAADCKAAGVEVVNCTPTTALRSFPTKGWAEVFK